MATSKTFTVKFDGDTKGLVGSFKDIQRQAGIVGKGVQGAANVMSTALSAVKFYAVARGLQSMVLGASGLQESMSKTNAVFGANAKEIQAWSKTTSKSFGVSQRAALEAAGTYGNLFQAFGVNAGQAQTMSKRLVELAADMASFNNVPIDDALTALRSGLSGETEPLKRFGVALNDARLKQEAMNLGLYKGKGNLDIAAKAQAAYALILKDTALQQGDVARTAGGFANQMKFLKSGLTDVANNIGMVLLPVITGMVKYINETVLPAFSRIQEAISLKGADAGFKQLKIELGTFLNELTGIAKMVKELIFLFIGIKIATPIVNGLRLAWKAVATEIGLTATAAQIAKGVMQRALVATGWGALVVGIGLVIDKLMQTALTADATNASLQKAFSGKNIEMVNGMNMAIAGTSKALEDAYINSEALKASRADEKLLNINKSTLKLGGSSTTTTTAIKGLTDAIAGASGVDKAAEASRKAIEKFKESLTDAKSKLSDAQNAFTEFSKSVSGSITSVINFGDAANQETGTFLENLVKQAAKASDFGTKVQKLLSMGLSESAISQVLAAGADAGIKIADEIIAGGATIVNQVNTLVSATQSLADAVGKQGADLFYSAGVAQGQALVQGVVDAIKAAGFTIEGTMADTIAAPVKAATTVAAATVKSTTTTKKTSAPAKTSAPSKLTAIQQKALSAMGIRKMATGGIVNQPTLAIVGEKGPEAVVPLSQMGRGGNNINITVNAGMGADGTLIGREIIDAIKRYERASGPVFMGA